MAQNVTINYQKVDGFNVSRFKSSVEKNGLLRNNKFMMRIYPPAGFSSANKPEQASLIETARYIELWGESTNIPGIAVNTNNFRRYGYGPMEKKPFDTVTNDISVSFIGDGKGALWEFFHQWIRLIMNFEFADGPNPDYNVGLTTGHKPYELSYKNEYASYAEIYVFADNGNTSDPNAGIPIKVNLREIYPVMLGDVQLNWGDTNNIMKVPVTFTFKDWFTLTSRDYNSTNANDSASYAKFFDHLKIPGTQSIIPGMGSSNDPNLISSILGATNITNSVTQLQKLLNL